MACASIQESNDFLSKDSNRISGQIARSLAINSPWINIIDTGTFESGVSDVQRSVVQEAVAPSLSQATPNWESFSCNRTPGEIAVGSTEYQYTPQSYFERGPKFCVTQAFSSFRNSIVMAERSIVDHTQTLWNSWIRYQLLLNSATKIVADSRAAAFNCILSSGFQTPFSKNASPNSPITFQFLKVIANYLHDSLLAGPEYMWGNGMDAHYRFISDRDTVDSLRSEIGIRNDLRYIAAGANKDAVNALTNYEWDGPYQGISFGVDQSILRASSYNQTTGVAAYVEPFAAQAATRGTKRVVNTAWLGAPLQVSYLLARYSFTRDIPQEFLGEGMTRFEKQFWGGKVVWHNQQDNTCNIKGDTGFHYYDLAAAMRPERPEFVIPIIHTRCATQLGLTSCTPQGYYSCSV